MRINNTSIDSLGGGSRAGAAQQVTTQTAAATGGASRAGGTHASDHANVSGAGNLVSLAKHATSAARQSKIASLTEQVRSGKYNGDTAQAGKAAVQDLLEQNRFAAR